MSSRTIQQRCFGSDVVQEREAHKPDNPLRRLDAWAAFQELERLVRKLADAIRYTDAELPAYAAPLPIVQRAPAGQARAKLPNPLVPPLLYGEPARQAAVETIQALRMAPEQDPRHARRCPGVIAASEDTLRLIQALNHAKLKFKNAVELIDEEDAAVRRAEMAKVVNYLSLMQSYRKVPWVHLHANEFLRPASVSFTWAKRATSTERRSVRKIRSDLKKEQGNPPPGRDPDHWHALIEAELDQLAHGRLKLPDTEILAVRPPNAPHPRMNIYMADVRKPWMWSASIPLFYPHTTGLDLVPVSPLPVLDTRVQRARRRDQRLEPNPLLERLHVYRYFSEYRELQ